MELSKERLKKILSEMQAVIKDCNPHIDSQGFSGVVHHRSRLYGQSLCQRQAGSSLW